MTLASRAILWFFGRDPVVVLAAMIVVCVVLGWALRWVEGGRRL